MGLRKLVSVILGIVILIVLLNSNLSAEFQYPLKGISPYTTPFGVQQIHFGLDYNRGERLFFQTVNKNRETYQLPALDLSIGISPRAEFLFSYPSLYLKQKDQRSNFGSGDLKIAAVIELISERRNLPDSAVKFGAKLPNADDIREFGTDQTDFFMGWIFLNKIGKVKLLVNSDLAILGNPTMNETKQDDILIYTMGILYPLKDNISAGFEIHGIEFSRFGNNRRFLRGGIAYTWRKILIDAGGAVGLTNESGDFQVGIGITIRYGLEKKDIVCIK